MPENIFFSAARGVSARVCSYRCSILFLQESGIPRTPYLDRLACFTVGEPPLTCPLAVVYKKNGFLSPAARTFIDLVRDFYSRYDRERE